MARRNDAACYNRLLVRRIRGEQKLRGYDAILWLGDYAHGSVPGVPTISFAQGPPGTDARSILLRRTEIQCLAGGATALKWETLARLRLSTFGLPALQHSDHIVVGSSVSRQRLATTYRIPRERISTLPYPIDLDLFQPQSVESPTAEHQSSKFHPLRVLWLGRIVPRKRLDVFLDGAALAVRQGLDLRLTIVGGVGFIPGYAKLIQTFPFPNRLGWEQNIPREGVPELMLVHDLLAQPRDEENFGSSVAEAQSLRLAGDRRRDEWQCRLPLLTGYSPGRWSTGDVRRGVARNGEPAKGRTMGTSGRIAKAR